MELNKPVISNLFLQIYQHELANCFNASHSINLALIEGFDDDPDTLDDIKFDCNEVFNRSKRLFTKMRLILYPELIKKSEFLPIEDIIQDELNALPPNPFKIKFSKSGNTNLLSADITTQLFHSVLTILMKNSNGDYSNEHNIELSVHANSVIFKYTSKDKFKIFESLKDQSFMLKEKSKLVFEYEFIKHILNIYPVSINTIQVNDQRSTTLEIPSF